MTMDPGPRTQMIPLGSVPAGPSRFGVFGTAEILGIQPAEAVELLFVDRQDEAILAKTTAAKALRKPDAASP